MTIKLEKQRNGGLLAIGTKYRIKIPPSFVEYKRGISDLFGGSEGHPLPDKTLFVGDKPHGNCYKCHKFEVVEYNSRRFGESASIDRVCLNCGADNGDIAD
jgi:hypothetical protein